MPVSKNTREYQAEKVSENDEVKILWDFWVQTDRHLEHNTQDTVVIEQRNVWIIELTIPGDARVENKELKTLTKYRDLAIEISCLWKKHTSVVPVVIGAWGTISRNFTQYYKQLQISESTPSELQKREY